MVLTGVNIATLNISRLGAYGTVQIDWQIGFEGANLPPGFTLGSLSPASGTLSLQNGVDSEMVTVQVRGNLKTPYMNQRLTSNSPFCGVLSSSTYVQSHATLSGALNHSIHPPRNSHRKFIVHQLITVPTTAMCMFVS